MGVSQVLRLGKMKIAVKRMIASNRRSPVIRGIHAVTGFVESSFRNEGSIFEINGERELLIRLRKADLRTVLDVGANVGDWLEQAIKVWPNARIHAFEVAPSTADTLEAHVKAIGASDRVNIQRYGASDAPGVQRMYYFPFDSQLTCDMPRHDEVRVVPFDAEMITLDDFAAKHSVDVVDFLKIDVEGAEHRVLDGFKGHLEAGKVRIIQFEYGAFATDTRVLLKDFYTRLAEKYWIGKIYPNGVDFRDYDWRIEDFNFCNYLCVLKTEPGLRDLAEGRKRG